MSIALIRVRGSPRLRTQIGYSRHSTNGLSLTKPPTPSCLLLRAHCFLTCPSLKHLSFDVAPWCDVYDGLRRFFFSFFFPNLSQYLFLPLIFDATTSLFLTTQHSRPSVHFVAPPHHPTTVHTLNAPSATRSSAVATPPSWRFKSDNTCPEGRARKRERAAMGRRMKRSTTTTTSTTRTKHYMRTRRRWRLWRGWMSSVA